MVARKGHSQGEGSISLFRKRGSCMRLAVVGGGVAGLSAAWLLARHHDLTLFEAEPRLGGHARTIDVTLDGVTAPVDTGFLVFNRRTYPHLCGLFDHLGVVPAPSEMSFSVSVDAGRLEWSGSSLGSLFAQPRNMVRPEFWSMLSDIRRFNARAQEAARAASSGESLGRFLERERFGRAFRQWYLLPMAGAIWSCPTATMLEYPLEQFCRFFDNHGLLQLSDRPQWYTLAGGARSYVARMAATVAHRVASVVTRVVPHPFGVEVIAAGERHQFDQVVVASHTDQALRLIEAPTTDETAVLGAIGYQRNRAIVHTDRALMPRRRAVWSAWNYIAAADPLSERPVGVSYLINKLQPLPFTTPVVVTLNPPIEPAADRVLDEFEVEHPVFGRGALEAQGRLGRIQGTRRMWFCGAWTGSGFHEDGIRSAVAVANAFGVYAPWQQVRHGRAGAHSGALADAR